MVWVKLAIILPFVAYYILEVFYDNILRELEKESKNNEKRRRLWHKLNFAMNVLVALVPTALLLPLVGWRAVFILPFLGSMRLLVLNLGLNILSEKTHILHLSSEGFESRFKGLEWLYYGMAIVFFLGSGWMLIKL